MKKFYRGCRFGLPFQSILLLPGDGSIFPWAFSISKAIFLGCVICASLQWDFFLKIWLQILNVFSSTDKAKIDYNPLIPVFWFFSLCFVWVTSRSFVNCIQWKLYQGTQVRLLGAIINSRSHPQTLSTVWSAWAKIARSSWFFLVFSLLSFCVALWS